MEKIVKTKNLMYSFVLAMSSSGGIGLRNDLPWDIKKDFKHFEEITTKIQPDNRLIEKSYTSSKHLTKNFLNKFDLFPVKEILEKKKINVVIMGRKTYESIPEKYRPLKNRLNIVLSSQDFQNNLDKDLIFFKNTEQCVEFLENFELKKLEYGGKLLNYELNELFIVGGSYIYDEFAIKESLKNKVKAIYLTIVHSNVECDVFWKVPENFETISVSKTEVDKEYVYDFRVLVNRNLLGKYNIDDLLIYDALTRHEPHEEFQYLNHIRDIIETGKEKCDRTGVGTISKFGCSMRFDCSKTFPLLTTKDTYWKGIVEELLWFVKGSTNVKPLQEKKVKIWDGNSTREYLDSIGLKDREEGDLGPVYGFQWRHSGADYVTMHEDYTGKGVDQLAEVIESIKNNPDSRRIIMCAWNPKDLKLMALPPCHVLSQFYVNDGVVSLQMYQRSCDMGLGVPFNIASYALLLNMVCQVTGTKPGEYIHILGDAHVYKNHVEPLKQQLERLPYPFPILKINPDVKDINDFKYSDFTLVGYKHHPKIKMEMAV